LCEVSPAVFLMQLLSTGCSIYIKTKGQTSHIYV
jgi:hypothetical protein